MVDELIAHTYSVTALDSTLGDETSTASTAWAEPLLQQNAGESGYGHGLNEPFVTSLDHHSSTQKNSGGGHLEQVHVPGRETARNK